MSELWAAPAPDPATGHGAAAAGEPVSAGAPRRGRALLVALVVGLLVAGVALWGATRNAPSTEATLAVVDLGSAARSATDQGSSTFEMTQTITVGERSVSFTMHGAMDFAKGLAQITIDLGEAAPALGVDRLEMRSNADTLYIRLPESRVAANGGRHWASATFTPGATQNDPRQLLNYLSSADGAPDRVGSDRVRGVATTRYRGRADVQKIAATLPEEMRGPFTEALDQVNLTHIPMDVWIDDDDLPRRVETRLEVQGVRTVSRMEMFGYGEPVQVALPPAADTARVTGFAGLTAAAGLPPGIFG